MKKIAIWFLRTAERLYLYAHGWRRMTVLGDKDNYVPPEDFEPKKHATYHRCHAVNAQRGVYAAATVALKKAQTEEISASDQERVLMEQLRASARTRKIRGLLS